MPLPLMRHFALPITASGEDPDENERRSRAELERSLRVADSALTQAERRLTELTKRLDDAGIP